MEQELYPQPVMQDSPRHQISISPLDYGYVVRIGCQGFAVESVETLIVKLNTHLRNPDQVSKDWLSEKRLPE